MKYWFQYQLNFNRLSNYYKYTFEVNTVCKRKGQLSTSGIDILTVKE